MPARRYVRSASLRAHDVDMPCIAAPFNSRFAVPEIPEMTSEQDHAESRRSTTLDELGTNMYFAEVAFRGDTHRLARLLVDDLEQVEKWSEVELGAMLIHQLTAALEPELVGTNKTQEAEAASSPTRLTFGDAIFGQAASTDSLRRIKEYSKAHLVRKDPCFPVEISRVLYYGSVLAAYRLHGERITSLTDAKFRTGVDWVLRQAWIDPQLREWFRSSLEFLAEPE
jgi:hypothetical protein